MTTTISGTTCPDWCTYHYYDERIQHPTDYAEMHYQFHPEHSPWDVGVNRAVRANGEILHFIYASASIEREMSSSEAHDVGTQFRAAADLLNSIEAGR